MLTKLLLYCSVFLLATASCFAQPSSKGITEIEKALSEEKFDQAETILQSVTEPYYVQRKPDSLVNYIFYVGKIAQRKTGTEQAEKNVNAFIGKIKTLSPTIATLRQAYIEAGEYYGFAGKNSQAYKANQQAYNYTLSMPVKTPTQLGMVENNMSTYAQRMGDLSLSKMHGRSALQHMLADSKPSYEPLYIAYNGMGSAMWYTSKTDSALLYFNLALQALAKTSRVPLNEFYRPAIVQNNLSALYGIEGKTTEAIKAMKQCISNIKSFIATPQPHPKKGTAVNFQFEATDNLAGIYKELGDLKQAQELLEYSYLQKQKHLQADDPAIFISRILLGQLYFAMKDFDKSLQYLNSGLNMISKADGDYLFWQADACNTLALLHDAKHEVTQAAHFYEKADSLYDESLQGGYDDIYLDFLRNAALFYAENKEPQTAAAKANKGYNYVVKNQGANSLTAFYQLLNLSQVFFLSGRFSEALTYSTKGLEVVNASIRNSANLLDSIKMELKKPKAILLKEKAQYELLQKKDFASLSAMLKELNEALSLLERRKSVISDAGDIGLVMADHADLLEFVKKITFDLYNLTRDQAYIDRLLSLHESGIYNRIRSRLDKNDSLEFAHLPGSVRSSERQLKSAITYALQAEGSHDEKMQQYFKATDNWNKYQEKIRVDHPRYYNMRYASIFKSLSAIQKTIPANTTLIRYFFIGKELLAVVADGQQEKLYPLKSEGLADQITALSQQGTSVASTANILHSLHQQLWLPLAKDIRHKKVVIVPDGILYNLNFEILTPQKIKSFKELGSQSLLADYTISYHYSLFLLDQKNKASVLKSFVAFAPGFSDKVKQSYRAAIKDSMEMDNIYLSLLPQPFTISLANKTQQLFGGNAFVNDQSTESSFKANAGDHKIIHIGTHAESNNDHPEFSRLIFAKNTAHSEEDNSLFVDEIYNCNLTSNLTVLTACESGKPGYQDGEGMISLAHAFNYAGSESILTGLWKIDEQASSLLLDLFYKNLLKGLPKDEALRQAKLSYLQQADGRMLAPQYWAGLVIMGDTSPVLLQQKGQWLSWAICGVLLLVVLAGFFAFKGRKDRTQNDASAMPNC
jgi:CHAT domain-containing protein